MTACDVGPLLPGGRVVVVVDGPAGVFGVVVDDVGGGGTVGSSVVELVVVDRGGVVVVVVVDRGGVVVVVDDGNWIYGSLAPCAVTLPPRSTW